MRENRTQGSARGLSGNWQFYLDSMRHICTDKNGVQQLGKLASVIRKKVSEKAKQIEKETLEIGRRIPIDDLYSKARPKMVAPDPDQAGKARD